MKNKVNVTVCRELVHHLAVLAQIDVGIPDSHPGGMT